jgi:hypothetical protein
VGSVKTDSTAKSWLDFEHVLYSEQWWKWVFARDLYTGDVLNDDKITEYLIRKATGESVEAYTERYKLADYTNHLGAVVDALAGMLFAVEEDAKRVLSADEEESPLGDPKDQRSIMGKLWQDADGAGTGFLTVWKQFTIELLINHVAWVMLDTNSAGDPIIRVIPSELVTNWREEEGVMVEALVKEATDIRGSLMDDPDDHVEFQYIHFTTEGWRRLHQDDDGNITSIGDGGEYSYVNSSGIATLPLFRVKLPMKRAVGYSLARKANAIFNKESERDHLLRAANFPKLNVIGTGEVFKKVTSALKKGAIALWNDPKSPTTHNWIAPDTQSAQIASKVLERKVEEFYVTAFREYGDAAQERTATEVRQDVSAGVGAFLEMLKSGVDDGEQGILWRLEQQSFPNDRTKWFQATVERSSNFLPIDVGVMIDKMKIRYFGEQETIPVGVTGLRSVVKQIAEWDKITVDDAEIDAAVVVHTIDKTMDMFTMLPVPAVALADMTVKLLVDLGLVDAEATIEMEGDDPVTVLEFMKEAALRLALAKEERETLAAQTPPAFGGM